MPTYSVCNLKKTDVSFVNVPFVKRSVAPPRLASLLMLVFVVLKRFVNGFVQKNFVWWNRVFVS